MAPIKIAIQRLELTAATVSLKIGLNLKSDLERTPDEIVYHTDSTTVLHYINSEKKRFQIFVANRVQLIHDHSTAKQWRYVQSSYNPADFASRGLSGQAMIECEEWFQGPAFLQQPEDEWPEQPDVLKNENEKEGDCALSSSVVVPKKITDVPEGFWKLISYYSDWYHLKRAVAFYIRLKKMLLRKVRQLEDQDMNVSSSLIVTELEEAEISILKFVQSKHFEHEIRALRETVAARGRVVSKTIKRSSSVYRLNPWLDQNGLL